jgi:hypothetical protein
VKYVLKDPYVFLILARTNRKQAEDFLIQFIKKERDRVAPSTVVNPFAGTLGIGRKTVLQSIFVLKRNVHLSQFW